MGGSMSDILPASLALSNTGADGMIEACRERDLCVVPLLLRFVFGWPPGTLRAFAMVGLRLLAPLGLLDLFPLDLPL